MPVYPPALVVTEVVEHGIWMRRLAKRAVAVAERCPDALVAESHNVGKAAAGEVGNESRMAVDLPTLVMTELMQDGILVRFAESAIALPQRGPDAVFSEPNNVSEAAARQMGKKTWMP